MRAALVLAGIIAACGPATPTDGTSSSAPGQDSPSGSVSAAPTTDASAPRPALAPRGWMYATWPEWEGEADQAPDLHVVAVSPDGERQEVAVLQELQAEPLDGQSRGLDVGRLADPNPVSVDGYLAVPFELFTLDTSYGYPRVYDLHRPDAPPLDLAPGRLADVLADEVVPAGSGSWGPTGELALGLARVTPRGNETVPARLVVDPRTGGRSVVPFAAGIEVSDEWIADGAGWYATRYGPDVEDEQPGLVSARNGAFVPLNGSIPLRDLSAGGRQRSRDGAVFSAGDADLLGRCPRVVTRAVDGFGRPISTVWRDACVAPARWLDYRFDVDGVGILLFESAGEEVVLIHAEAPGREEILGRFPIADLRATDPGELRLDVYGLMEGPGPGELLAAFQAGVGAPLFLYSTRTDRLVSVTPSPEGYVSFAGFSTGSPSP